MPALITLPPLLLIVVLAVSGVGKLVDLGSARATLHALRLEALPARMTVSAVAGAELLVAVGLALGTGTVSVAAAIAALAATASFLVVAVRAQSRRSTDECGCFGPMASTRVGPWMTARNTALTALAALTLLGAVIGPSSRTLIERVADAPLTTAALVSTAVAVAIIGGSLREVPAPGASVPDAGPPSVPDAAVLAPDGTVVVPRQRALRGRAQLLVFVRRGCSSCEALIARASEDFAAVDVIDIRLIAAVGDGDPTPPDGPVHTDPSGTFAQSLGIPSERPAGILLTTSGELLLPYAAGADETSALIDTVLAAAASAAENA